MAALRQQLTAFASTAVAGGGRPTAILLLERFGDIVACSGMVRSILTDDVAQQVVWVGKAAYRDVAMSIPGVAEYVPVQCYGELEQLLDDMQDWTVVDLNLNGKTCPCCNVPWRNRSGKTSIDTENYYDFGPLVETFAQVGGGAMAPELSRTHPDDLPGDLRGEHYVVMHSESEEAARGWHADGWRTVVDMLLAETTWRVVHVGVRAAAWLPNDDRVTDLGGRTSVKQLLAAVEHCRLFIGIDSSVAHVANAHQRPGLVLLGRYRAFAKYLPYTGHYGEGAEGALVVRHATESVELPPAVVLLALRAAIRRVSAGRMPGPGGPWDLRASEWPVVAGEPNTPAEPGEPDQAIALAVDDRPADWLQAWQRLGERASDLILVMPEPCLRADTQQSYVDHMDEFEALGCRYVSTGSTVTAMHAAASASPRHLRVRGQPMAVRPDHGQWRLCDLQTGKLVAMAGNDRAEIRAADIGIHWLVVDCRSLSPDHPGMLEAAARLLSAMRTDSTFPVEVGQLVVPVGSGCQASLDAAVRNPDGALARLAGWAYLERTGRPPDTIALAARVDGGSRLLLTARFPRWDRQDVATAHARPDARFCGWVLNIPDRLDVAPDALELLVHDGGCGRWHRIVLP